MECSCSKFAENGVREKSALNKNSETLYAKQRNWGCIGFDGKDLWIKTRVEAPSGLVKRRQNITDKVIGFIGQPQELALAA
jgi:hypothetical protein